MKKSIFVFLSCILVSTGTSYSACSPQDILFLEAAKYTTDEINTICPLCNSEDIIRMSQDGKKKNDIIKACSRSATPDNIPAYVLLFTKPLTFGFDAYHTNKALKQKPNDGELTKTESGEEFFKVYLKYTLPVSSMVYAFDENRPAKPHPLLKAFKLYAEGNYSNAIKSEDASSSLSIKTESTLYYNVGVKFETDIETLFSRGKTYKYYSDY